MFCRFLSTRVIKVTVTIYWIFVPTLRLRRRAERVRFKAAPLYGITARSGDGFIG